MISFHPFVFHQCNAITAIKVYNTAMGDIDFLLGSVHNVDERKELRDVLSRLLGPAKDPDNVMITKRTIGTSAAEQDASTPASTAVLQVEWTGDAKKRKATEPVSSDVPELEDTAAPADEPVQKKKRSRGKSKKQKRDTAALVQDVAAIHEELDEASANLTVDE